MADKFDHLQAGFDSPPAFLDTVSPNDGQDLATATRAINVGNSGDVRVTTVGGDTVTIFVAAGIAFPVRAARIWATGTTASNIVAMH